MTDYSGEKYNDMTMKNTLAKHFLFMVLKKDLDVMAALKKNLGSIRGFQRYILS